MSDLELLFKAEEEVAKWKAERNYTTARLEIATMRKNMRYLISQHEPLNSSDIDREKLRYIFSYIEHGSILRLRKEIENGPHRL